MHSSQPSAILQLMTASPKMPPFQSCRIAAGLESVFSLSEGSVSEGCLPKLTIQTKKGMQGIGLGLSITNDIEKAHGGTISIRTKEYEGTTFIIELHV